MLFGDTPGFSQELIDDRVVKRERLSTHEHEVLLVALRVFFEFLAGLLQVETSEVPPSTLCVQVALEWIEVVFGW